MRQFVVFKLMHEYKHIQLVLIIYCEYMYVCFIYRMSITPDDQSIVYM